MTGIPGLASKATSFVPGLNWLKIAKIGIPILLALGAFLWLRGVLNERAELRSWQDQVVAATDAEMPFGVCKNKKGKPVDCKVTAKDVVPNIQWLGRERRTVGAALDIQSAKLVTAKGVADAAANEAAAGRKQALQRNEDRDRTIRAIRDPKRSTGLSEAEWGKL